MQRLVATSFALLFLCSAARAELRAISSVPGPLNQCGSLKGANLNSTADQQINFTPPSATYVLVAIRAQNASAPVTTAVGGIYSATAKGGTAVVAASQVWNGLTSASINTPGNFANLTVVTASYNFPNLYLSLTTPEGSAKTADLYIYCYPVL